MIQCFDQLEKISKMERTQFLCNDCGKDFVVDVKLGLHMYAMHTEKPFECAQCGERGSGVAKFKNHMRKHRSQNNVSKCDSCDFETPHAGNLKRHVKLHTAVKPKKSKSIKTCEPCGKTFDRKDSFDRHMKVHLKESAQTFGCTQCDDKFERKDSCQVMSCQDILEAPRFHRQPRSLKSGYFCELNSTGASEV